MHDRDHYKQKAAKTLNDGDWCKYKTLRNKVTLEIRNAKVKYYKNNFEKSAGNSKKTWKIINHILSSKPKPSNVDMINANDEEITDKNINNYGCEKR